MRTSAATLLTLCITCSALAFQQESAEQPALVRAAIEGDARKITALLEDGADIGQKTMTFDEVRGWTPLMHAIRHRNADAVRVLLDAGAELTPEYVIETVYETTDVIHAEIVAAQYADRAIMEMIITAGGDPTLERNDTDSLLHNAATNFDPELIRYLIDDLGLDPDQANEAGQTPLFFASSWLTLESLDPYIEDRRPRDAELELSRLLVMNELVASGASVNLFDSSGYTPLLLASGRGTLAQVRFLLENGAETFDDPAEEYKTQVRGGPEVERLRTIIPVCIVAADAGDPGVISLLAEFGADLNATTSQGRDLLQVAVDKGNTKVIPELIEIGFDPEIVDPAGRSQLMRACLVRSDTSRLLDQCRGHVPTARVLLGAGLDPNARDDAGRTALHYAAGSGVPELVELFLEAGADPSAEDNAGLTPLDYTTAKAPRLARFRLSSAQRALGAPLLEAALEAKASERDEEADATDHVTDNGQAPG